MKEDRAKLYFMCGKMAAGKSTHAKELAQTRNAVLLIQDEFLGTLYAGDIRTIQDFVKYSARVEMRCLFTSRISCRVASRWFSTFPGNTEFSAMVSRDL
jgi:thymidine kinase